MNHHGRKQAAARFFARFDSLALVALYGTKFRHSERGPMNANATSANKIKGPAYRVQVIDRALSVLEVLADEGQPLSLVKLSKSLDLPKSTTMRLLMVLEGHRFVQKNAESGLYRLGLKLFELGSKAVAQFDLTERAQPHLERMVSRTGETAYLGVLDGGEAMVLERVESSRAVRVPTSVGWRHPAHSTAVGKVLLAFTPESKLTAVLGKGRLQSYTPKTITSVARLREELQRVRERRFALDDEETEDGLRCIAAAVREHSGQVGAALGIIGPAYRIPDDAVATLAAIVIGAADKLSAELGYRVAEPRASRRDGGLERQ
jgi:DNA-binding IclR family transcriptional regulator